MGFTSSYYSPTYRANVAHALERIDSALDDDFGASQSTFEILAESKRLIEKMADEIENSVPRRSSGYGGERR